MDDTDSHGVTLRISAVRAGNMTLPIIWVMMGLRFMGASPSQEGKMVALPIRPWPLRLACGTPVLAFRCGSVLEIVEDGVTGKVF